MTAPRKGMRTCTKCEKNRSERFFKPRGRICSSCRRRRVSVASRETRIYETYGITLEEYDELLEAQDGKCAICRRAPRYNMDVDHDHAIEKQLRAMGVAALEAVRRSIRGLLCKLCNRRMLPAARDDGETLLRAAQYLVTPPAPSVLGAGVRGAPDLSDT